MLTPSAARASRSNPPRRDDRDVMSSAWYNHTDVRSDPKRWETFHGHIHA